MIYILDYYSTTLHLLLFKKLTYFVNLILGDLHSSPITLSIRICTASIYIRILLSWNTDKIYCVIYYRLINNSKTGIIEYVFFFVFFKSLKCNLPVTNHVRLLLYICNISMDNSLLENSYSVLSEDRWCKIITSSIFRLDLKTYVFSFMFPLYCLFFYCYIQRVISAHRIESKKIEQTTWLVLTNCIGAIYKSVNFNRFFL